MFGVRRSRISISVPGHCHLQVESRVRRPGPPRVSPARRDCLRLEITIGATAQSRPSKPEVTVESNVRSTRLSMMFCFSLPGHCLSILSRPPRRTATVRVTGRHRAGPGAPPGRGINARPGPGPRGRTVSRSQALAAESPGPASRLLPEIASRLLSMIKVGHGWR